MSIDISKLTIKSAHEKLLAKEFTARELAQSYLDVIREKNPDIHAYLEVYDDVLAQADRADQKIKEGTATLLTGIPIGLKDNLLLTGHTASAGSKILENYTAPFTASTLRYLQEAGAVFLGRCNMDEFAMGSSTENSAYGVTKNPHDTSRVAGGSSGGSAAALAMDGALVTLGSDTGGSIRQPASLCGVVGLMPSYGTVSRYGVMALGSSLDQIGPFTKTVEDAEIMYEALSRFDPHDSTSVPKEKRIPVGSVAKKIGVPWKFVEREGVDAQVLANFKESLKKFESLGYEIVPIDLDYAHYALAVYYILMPAEASTNLARYDGIRFGLSLPGENNIAGYSNTRGAGFGKETRRRIMLGTYVLSHGYYDAYYKKATQVRALITKEFKKVFESVSLIATPTSPIPAFKIGEKSNDPLAMYLADIFTVPVNVAQIPAISIPSGKTTEGLPLGIQLIAAQFGEKYLFEAGKGFEKK